jgi:hypothetical protein
VPTIDDEVRTVFEAYASRDVPTVDRRAAVQRRIDRRRRQRWTAGLVAVTLVAGAVVAIATAGDGDKRAATVPTAPRVVTTPTLTVPAHCDGSSAESVLSALFAALDSGQHVDVATFFVTPRSFNLWWDPSLPSGQVITYDPGPYDQPFTLNELTAHLDMLAGRHLHVTVSAFQAGGYTNTDYNGSPGGGGSFTYDLKGGPSGSATDMSPGGKGLVDCDTGKLKALVVDEW